MFSLVLQSLLQLLLASSALAAPMTVQGGQPWHYGVGGGIIGFIVLVLDIIVWRMHAPS